MRIDKTFMLAPAAFAAALLTGCFMGGGDENKGYVDSFTPGYTAAKGTVYAGDYFPLNPNTSVPVQGTMTGTAQVHVSGKSDGQSFSQDTTLTIAETMSGNIQTLAEQALSLSAGSVNAVPQVTTTVTSGGDYPEAQVSTAYYQKTGAGVNLVATLDEGAVKENPRATFMKTPLTVGDNWESSFSGAVDPTGSSMSGQITAKARTFVTGKEAVTVAGKSWDAVRLDQVIEMSGNVSENGVHMTLSANFHCITYFAEGTGLLKQTATGTMNIKGAMTESGTTVNVSETANVTMSEEISAGPVIVLGKTAPAARGFKVARPEFFPKLGYGAFSLKWRTIAETMRGAARPSP